MAKKELRKYGPWAFYLALFMAVILAFVQASWAVLVLAVMGLVVGFLNISQKEATTFLIASLAWMVAGNNLGAILGTLPVMGMYLEAFLSNVVTFVGPAAAVVSIMALYYISKD
ncbi:MAG: hypothetical protein ABIG95_03215 [Candidatus Woesearchaeota archaeon]